MKNSKLYPSLVLCTIGLVAALLLSVVNMITGPMIEAAQNASANAALLEVLPDGKNFKKIDITSEYPAIVTAGYKADGGYVFQMTVTGKSTGLVIMCGIDADGNVVGTKVIADEETPSYAEKVFPQVEGTAGKYTGMSLDNFDPYLVSGATLTSKAYSEAIKAALQSAILAAGGSVDTRTPEQILQDNCNAALGTTGVKFNKWFALEVFEGIDAVYTAEDKSGRVYFMGETFIAACVLDRCVSLYSMEEWDSLLQKIAEAPMAETRKLLRKVTESAEDVTPDAQGRILLNKNLIAYAGLEKPCLIIGAGRRAEIWNPAVYEETMADMTDDKLEEEFIKYGF
jgi:MraZ protein